MPNTTLRLRVEREAVATFCGFDILKLPTRWGALLSTVDIDRALEYVDPNERDDIKRLRTLPYIQRIIKSFLILAQRDALAKRVEAVKLETNRHAVIVVFPYTHDEYYAAQLVLDRFADALGRTLLAHDDTRFADRKATMLRRVMTASLFAVLEYARREFDLLPTPENETNAQFHARIALRAYLRSFSLALHDVIIEMLKDACTVVDSGYIRLRYELDHGVLGNYHALIGGWDSISTRQLNRVIDECLSFANDYDECMDAVHDAGYERCPDCDSWEHDEHTARTYSDDYVCRSCAERSYVFSDYHDCYVHNEDAVTALDRNGDEVTIHHDCDDFAYDDDEETYVHSHYERRSNVLRRYHSSKHDNAFHPIPSAWSQENRRFFGIELEVECRKGRPHQHAERLNEALNDGRLGQRCMFEEDGSLSNGFEIITQPMGLDNHYQFWEWLNVKQNIADLRSHDTSTCGLHIHVNRDNITTMQLNKLAVFVHSPDNSNLIRAIARRYGVGYASMHTKKLGTAHHESRGDARYEAINMTNRRTIEFRMFKGTLKMQSLLAALEFTNALLRFTAPASEAGFILTAAKFLDYINSSEIKQDTRNLRTYLDKVGFTVSA